MSTAISTNVKTIDYPALSPNSRQARIIAANLEGEPMREQDLVRVPTPAGGGTVWSIDNQGNTETTDEIVGLFVAEGRRGVLWPKPDPSDLRPVIVSHDLLVGYRVSDELGDINPDVLERYRVGDRRYDWQALSNGPEFGWDSATRQRRSRNLKESRVMAILREGDVWPVLLTIGAGSLGGWLAWRKRMPSFIYECVVGLKLQKVKNASGQAYSMIVPRVIGIISEEQGDVAKKVYHDPLTAMFNAPPSGASAAPGAGDDE